MRPFIFFIAVFALLVLPSAYASAAAPGQSKSPVSVSSIQYTSGKDRSRIVIILTEKTDYRFNPTFAPLALQIDLNGAVLSPALPQFLPVNDGRVKGIESFQYAVASAKVTIGLEKGMDYKVSFKDTEGFVILIDVAAKKAATDGQAEKKAP
ncbi:MAG: AMIN domain-containing protein [Deltaproteobacteria bacterium]|nr:AMIN domain-containing protein [Deltaproteobacteria bacterium]